MSFTKKTWKDRQSEHPTRRVLNPTGTTNTYDVSRAEGLVMEDGDAFDASNMNDLENRVAEGINGTAAMYTAKLTLGGQPAPVPSLTAALPTNRRPRWCRTTAAHRR